MSLAERDSRVGGRGFLAVPVVAVSRKAAVHVEVVMVYVDSNSPYVIQEVVGVYYWW